LTQLLIQFFIEVNFIGFGITVKQKRWGGFIRGFLKMFIISQIFLFFQLPISIGLLVFFLFVIIKIFEAFYKVGIETYTKDQGFI
jgi:hypothetical protein